MYVEEGRTCPSSLQLVPDDWGTRGLVRLDQCRFQLQGHGRIVGTNVYPVGRFQDLCDLEPLTKPHMTCRRRLYDWQEAGMERLLETRVFMKTVETTVDPQK